jgi:hypothetical protein
VDDEQPSTGDPSRPTVVIRDLVATRRLELDDGDSTAAIVRRLVPSLPRGPQAVVAALAVVLVMAGGAFVYVTRSSLSVEGIEDGQSLSRRDLATLTLRIDKNGPGADEVHAEVNGVALPLRERGEDLVVGSDALREAIVEGTNTLAVSLSGRFGVGGSTVERTFRFDPRGPQLTVPAAVTTPPR